MASEHTRTGASNRDAWKPFLDYGFRLPVFQSRGPGRGSGQVRMASVNPLLFWANTGQPAHQGCCCGLEGVRDLSTAGLHCTITGPGLAFDGRRVNGFTAPGPTTSLFRPQPALWSKPAMRGRGSPGRGHGGQSRDRPGPCSSIVKGFGPRRALSFNRSLSSSAKLMAGLARDNGYAMIAIIAK